MTTLFHVELGLMDYAQALSLQEALVSRKQKGLGADFLLFVQHPHVFTIGRAGKEENLLNPGDIPYYRVGRGGDISYHGPGQMVVYPLVDLKSKLRRNVHLYLRRLEESAIGTLAAFGISARQRSPWTGIWLGDRKIASIGIAVRRGITQHGLALNVDPDLTYFRRIVPCGLSWATMTSMSQELGRDIPMASVRKTFLQAFVKRFGYTNTEELCLDDILTGSACRPPEAPTTCV